MQDDQDRSDAESGDPDFPSGPWTGFWLEPARHRQDMNLAFANGVLRGRGSDGIGWFLIVGRYDPETRKVWWTKTYPGSHDVHYEGYREHQGIWGVWSVAALAGTITFRGGFRIWPRGHGEGDARSAHAEEGEPLAVVGPAPALAR